jgi:hypothetical protein
MGIIVLHIVRRGEPKLFPSLKSELSSLGNSSRKECSYGDPLQLMPPNPALKLPVFE